MDIFVIGLAAATLSIYIAIGIEFVRGSRSIRSLQDIAPATGPVLPRVSIVVAARNEERNIEEALRSLLRQDYASLEFIVVDDRSTDATPRILSKLQAEDSRLRTIHIDNLPSGWLGKNHALWRGAEKASGEIILFTDADIIMEPTVLSRAVAYFADRHLDHLTITPGLRTPTALLEMFCIVFFLFFSLFTRPWRARDPKSNCHIGIGAFNMVRAKAYVEAGGHKAIALRPDDDLKLGKLLKKQGFKQDIAYGGGLIAVEWYATMGELIHGLSKNAFAAMDYNVSATLSGLAFQLIFSIWPFAAIFLTRGPAQLLNLAAASIIVLIAMNSALVFKLRPNLALGFPIAGLLFVYIVLRAMTLNLLQGGITWRETFYKLEDLKRDKL